MNGNNIAIVRGLVSSEPRQRELPSGSVVTNVEVTTQVGDERVSVPVVVYDQAVPVGAGDEIVVCGRVVRRYFRAGGTTASRTEVVADRVVPARQRRRVERTVAAATEAIISVGLG